MFLDQTSRQGRQVHLAKFPIDHYNTPAQNKYQRWREMAKDMLSPPAQMRLEWIIFYFTVGRVNASSTATHFGISRKTFHKYLGRFDETNIKSLAHIT